MWLQVTSFSSAVGLDDLWAVKSDSLKRIDSNKHDSAVGVYTMLGIAITNSVQDLQWGSARTRTASVEKYLKAHLDGTE